MYRLNKSLLLACLWFVGLTGPATAAQVRFNIRPYQEAASAVPVVIRLSDCPQILPQERCSLAVYVNGKEVASQLDDLDADGMADELAFLVDIPARRKLSICIKPVKHHRTYPREVFAEMFLKSKEPREGFTPHSAEGKNYYIKPVTEQTFFPGEDSYHSMHHHGVAFESALMAYRIYFDKKQTIDVYAKKTPRLELDATKWYPTDEQLAAHYGDDVLRVSGYIGVGACKPWNGKKMVHFDPVASRTQRIVSQGPVRTICEVTSHGWQGTDITTRYTLYARHRDVEAEVFITPAQGDTVSWSALQLVTGVQRIGEANFYTNHKNLVASFGTAYPVNDTVKYAKETVGLAVYVPEQYTRELVRDANNNLVLLKATPYIKYYFTVVSLKEDNPPARTDGQFFTFVELWATELEKHYLSF